MRLKSFIHVTVTVPNGNSKLTDLYYGLEDSKLGLAREDRAIHRVI